MNIKKNIAVSETGFLFNPSNGDTFSLNPSGQEIVSLMKQDYDSDEIMEYFINKYAIDQNTLEKDMYDFMNMLREYKITQ